MIQLKQKWSLCEGKVVGQYQGQTWSHTELLPLTPLKKYWCAHGPSSSRYFYHGPRWDWIQMGHLITSLLFLPLSLSLSLSLCSGLEFPALTSNPFKCRPHFIPQRPSEEPGIESSSEIVAACAHPNKCDPSDDMEIQYMFDKCDFLIHSLPRKQDIIMADLYKRYCKFTTQLLSVSLTIQNCGFKIAWGFHGLCFC